MPAKKRKINSLKNILIICLFSVILSLSPVEAPKTQAFWGEIVQVIFQEAFEAITTSVQGMIRGMMKQMSAQVLIKLTDKLASGGGGASAAFIVNWQDYLVQQPLNQTNAYMNDYLSQMTLGRNSRAGYQAEGFFSAGSGSYFSSLAESAKSTFNRTIPTPTYEGNPNQMFDNGSFKNMGVYLSGANNRWAFNIAVQNEYQTKMQEFMDINKTQSIAYQGFMGTGNNGSGQGNITYPGILAKENIANIQNIPNMSLASATDIGEVISAVVSKTISSAMTQGFNGAMRIVNKKMDVQVRVNSGVNNAMQQSGPGARFNLPSTRQ